MSNLPHNSAYDRAIEFLMGRLNYERVPPKAYRKREYKLDRMRELLDRLGNPQEKLRIVHIAGTKGKGSTTAIVASIAAAAGLRVGAFTSPHLKRLEERIAINGQACAEDELVQLVQQVRPVADAMDQETSAENENRAPTYFELTTALALLHFAAQQVDLAILEVGMGGRLDSTNVCQPICTAITSISYDHMRQLGDTLEEIAAEKAGIIKPGVPVVSGVTTESAQQVVADFAARQHAPLVQVGRDFHCGVSDTSQVDGDGLGWLFDFESTAGGSLPAARLNLLGRHQVANAGVALAIVGQLERQGFRVTEEAVRQGLLDVRCPARVELLQAHPAVIVDAAHNVASIEALLDVLRERYPRRPRVLVFGSTRGKDVEGMLRRLLPEFDEVVLTRYENNPRAVSTEDLKTMVDRLDPNRQPPRVCPDPAAAWAAVQQLVTPDASVCITGSFFIAAEMRELVLASACPSQAVVGARGG